PAGPSRQGEHDAHHPGPGPQGPHCGPRLGAGHGGHLERAGQRRARRERVTADAASTITSGALPIAVVVALAAGLVSFASPCVLPLVPGFLGYVTGLSDVALEQRRRSNLVLGALLFVLGFTVVFIVLVAVASAVSFALREHLDLLTRIGGAVVIVLALVFLGVGSGIG